MDDCDVCAFLCRHDCIFDKAVFLALKVIVLKFFFYFMLLLVFLLFSTENKQALILHFLFYYAVFTVLEVSMLYGEMQKGKK